MKLIKSINNISFSGNYLAVLFFIGLASCNVKGLTSGYKKLSTAEKQLICNYPSEKACQFININGKQMVEKLQKDSFALVHIWVPHCKGPNCFPLKYYRDYAKKKNCSLYIVADSYDMESIDEQITTADTIYFIDPKYYETNFRFGYTKKFINDLVNNKPIHDSLKYASYFYYRKGVFVASSSKAL